MNILEEKKVEYIELIYDLIFVYLLGRSASLLDLVEGGFVSLSTFASYLASSLIFIQIWYDTTLFSNRYGKNGLSDKIMFMVNMFLLYIMGTSTGHGGNGNYPAYCFAWALILVNLALNYLLQLKDADDIVRKHISQNAAVLLLQALLIAGSVPVYAATGDALAAWTVLFGFLASAFVVKLPVSFGHLTERVMLYVVFTFGEMVVIVAEYFSAGLNLRTLYFALMSFLIVAGLFFSYGFVYDKLLDREGERCGNSYMLLHVFLLVALSCITTALEFMREAEILALPKTVMMVASMLVYFLCLAMTEKWSKRRFLHRGKFSLILIIEFIVFVFAMVLTMSSGDLSIAVTVAFIYIQLLTLVYSENHTEERESSN